MEKLSGLIGWWLDRLTGGLKPDRTDCVVISLQLGCVILNVIGLTAYSHAWGFALVVIPALLWASVFGLRVNYDRSMQSDGKRQLLLLALGISLSLIALIALIGGFLSKIGAYPLIFRIIALVLSVVVALLFAPDLSLEPSED